MKYLILFVETTAIYSGGFMRFFNSFNVLFNIFAYF